MTLLADRRLQIAAALLAVNLMLPLAVLPLVRTFSGMAGFWWPLPIRLSAALSAWLVIQGFNIWLWARFRGRAVAALCAILLALNIFALVATGSLTIATALLNWRVWLPVLIDLTR